MRAILRTLTATCVVLACAGTSQAQSNITLVADADTTVRENDPTTPRPTSVLEIRSRDVAGTGRQLIPYIRFDLGVLANAPATGAAFSVVHLTTAYLDGQVTLYGLPDDVGNTPQDWVDSGLVYNSTGLEIPGDGNAETQDLDTGRLEFIADLPASSGGGATVTVANAALDAFLADRYANGGLATLILVNADGTDRYLTLGYSENGNGPTLDVVGDLAVDTTPPTVVSVSPTDGAVDVPVSAVVQATFDEEMDAATITTTTFLLYDSSSNLVDATVAYDAGSFTATLTPSNVPAYEETYTAVLVGGAGGMADAAGNPLAADFTWSFTTGPFDPGAPITLLADADATIRENDNSPQFDNILEIRARNNPGSGRQRIPYVRFDLRVLADAPAAGAEFSVVHLTTSYAEGQVTLYGLPDVLHNTPQGWVDSGLVYTSTGLEIPGDGNPETQDLDPSRLQFIADLPASSGGGATVTVANATLDAFIADRYANGGLATLILVGADGTDRYVTLGYTEDGNGPTLEVVGGLQPLPPDTAPPTVAGHSPTNGAIDVELDAVANITFSEPMDATTITNNLSLLDGTSSPVPATVIYDAATLTATLTPDAFLLPDATYTGTVTGGPGGVADAAGNPMAADYAFSFTTELDSTPPMVISVSPTNGAVDVPVSTGVQATFDEEMDAASITTTNFLLYDSSSNRVDATVTYDAGSFTATLTPASFLAYEETHTAVLVGGAGGIADKVGNPMAMDFVWSFTTGDASGGFVIPVDADAAVQSHVPDANRSSSSLLVRSLLGSPFREWLSYLRFDVAAAGEPPQYVTLIVAGAPGTNRDARFSDADDSPAEAATLHIFPERNSNSVFTIFRNGGVNYNEGQLQVWGLLDVEGNTPQDWDESSLTYNTTGAEVVKPAEPGLDRASDRVVFLGDLPASPASGESISFSSAALDRFIFATPRAAQITDIAAVAGAVEVTWNGIPGHQYNVERAADPGSDWNEVLTGYVGMAVNTYTDTVPFDVQGSYRVLDVVVPPSDYFFDDFESDPFANGWTVVSGASHNVSTQWDWGTPTTTPPGGAQEGTGAMGTNLSGNYGPDADIGLISPVINMAGATSATLVFQNSYAVEGDTFDFGEVFLRDAAGAEIPGLAGAVATYNGSSNVAWTQEIIVLPAEALDRTIRVEFRFISDNGFEFAGWYIDQVLVTE